MRGKRTAIMPRVLLIVCGVALTGSDVSTPAHAQGTSRDNGHCNLQGRAVFACWNPNAGRDIPERLAERGWDFRINIPHTLFQRAALGSGSGATLVGVVEGPLASQTMQAYGHINNSIWMFRVTETDGRIYAKALPSSRDVTSSTTRNVRSLTSGWSPVGSGDRRFRRETVAAAVVGEGIGTATIYVAARAEDGTLWLSEHRVVRAGEDAWTGPWVPLGISSHSPPSLVAAFGDRLALAWIDPESRRVRSRVYAPQVEEWGPPFEVAAEATGAPQLLWDGVALNVLFVGASPPVLRHALARSHTGPFQDLVNVSSLLAVRDAQFHAMTFNSRIHVVVRQDPGSPGPSRAFYTTSTTPFGARSRWSILSETGLTVSGAPRIAYVNDVIYVIGPDADGLVRYSRKDSNKRGNDLTGAALSDRWLEQGALVSRGFDARFSDLHSLTFNGDAYLTGFSSSGADIDQPGVYLVNFSRAAVRRLITDKLRILTRWGSPGARAVMGVGQFARFNADSLWNTLQPLGGGVPMLGDFDGDGMDDLIVFRQRAEPGIGPAPVYVSLNVDGTFQEPRVWHSFFSLQGEIPMVGDFNGDGFDDIVTFTQTEQRDAAGNVIGPAVVWVSLNEPDPDNPGQRRFGQSRVWHRFFSLQGEIPMVGDFNGDGFDDIITFTQTEQRDAAGNVIGPAVVWVSLNERDPDNPGQRRFGQSRVWHRFFSLEGEIPMVGDFDGDGKADIVTFVQRPQNFADGTLIGRAPVWVSLSDGSRFGESRIWHTSFSPRGEVPRVADLNMDGRDDIISFIRDNTTGVRAHTSYAALSSGGRFETSTTWMSDFVSRRQIPFVGSLLATTARGITGSPDDPARRLPDIFAFRDDGAVHVAEALAQVPLAAGAPWERYKWFTDKGIGVMMFPEWIWEGTRACISRGHSFFLLGLAGSGGATQTSLSVRIGSRQGHVLEELGHSIFANCFRSDNDPFALFDPIFNRHWRAGGFGAGAIADICEADSSEDYYDCRSGDTDRRARAEHIFLDLMKKYRASPEEFRDRIVAEQDPVYREHLRAAYRWLKDNWYEGLEFRSGAAINGSMAQIGLHCLTDDCRLQDPAAPVPPDRIVECQDACAHARDVCMAEAGQPGGLRPAQCVQLFRACMERCQQEQRSAYVGSAAVVGSGSCLDF